MSTVKMSGKNGPLTRMSKQKKVNGEIAREKNASLNLGFVKQTDFWKFYLGGISSVQSLQGVQSKS